MLAAGGGGRRVLASGDSGYSWRRPREPAPGSGHGRDRGDPRPGTERADVDLAFGTGADAGGRARRSRDILFWWDGRGPWLADAWRAWTLRWIQSASDGVDGLLFPESAAGDVVLTNARGVFDEPIAECVLGMLLAIRTDSTGILDTAEGRWEWPDAGRSIASARGGRPGPDRPSDRACARVWA